MKASPLRLKAALAFSISLASTLAMAQEKKPTQAQLDFFEKKIRPVLVGSCYDCHSAAANKVKGGLLVDTRDGLLKGGDSGAALIPGKPDKSLLIKAINGVDKDLLMPPKGEKLTSEQVRDFEAWIAMGAPDPREAKPGAAAPMAIDWEKAKAHWAFQPVSNPQPPKVSDAKGWGKTPVDAFVMEKLKANGLTPSPEADRRTLIRRATFDLTGLPPTPEEVEAFVNDKSPDAFAKVVDRLLDSPRYGERWGRHWLDIARYADNSGDRNNRSDQRYPFAWTYRDYVIKAFNQDLPFDQFILQQIAADKLPTANDGRTLAALGFITVGKRFMGNINEVIDDRIDVVTQGFMALTVSCARCHDHKFDPVPTKDYYSLHGVFANSVEPKVAPFIEPPAETPEYLDYKQKFAALEKELASVSINYIEETASGIRQKAGDYLLATRLVPQLKDKSTQRGFLGKMGLNSEIYERWEGGLPKLAAQHPSVFTPWTAYSGIEDKDFARDAKQITERISKDKSVNRLLADALVKAAPKSIKEVAEVYGKLFRTAEKDWQAAVSKSESTPKSLSDANLEAIRLAIYSDPVKITAQDARRVAPGNNIRNLETRVSTKITDLQMTHPGSPARAMALEDTARPRDSRVFIRGEPRNLGPVVPRQFLQIIDGEEREPFKTGSGRLDLAREIASRDNPLTSRVVVNRVWQNHFGEGIVRTPSDFGLRSDKPTHPELLDWLAAWFMDNGWSMKKLHRLIMLSSVYQQSSQNNEKFAQIDPANLYLWRMNLQRLDFEVLRDTLIFVGGKLDETMGGPSVNLTRADAPPRRTVYGTVDRQQLPEMYRIFDFANPDMTSSQRYMTTVPQQALFMMNSPLVVEQAKNLVNRPDFAAQKKDQDKVRLIYQVLFQRAPTQKEMELAFSYLADPVQQSGPVPVAALQNNETSNATDKRALREMVRSRSTEGSRTATKSLNNWESFAQVMLLSNEMVFVN